jgi:hypothetical protein
LAVFLEAPGGRDHRSVRDLVRISAWSMNAPGRPPDGVLARHLSIAERGAAEFRPLAAAALDALLAGDENVRPRACERGGGLRGRRTASFKLLAASAGLRPLVLYVDLMRPSPPRKASALRGLEPGWPGRSWGSRRSVHLTPALSSGAGGQAKPAPARRRADRARAGS